MRGQQNDRFLRPSCQTLLARRHIQSLNTFKDRFRLQDHAFAAAKWAVIYSAMPIAGKLPQIVDPYVHQFRFPSSPQNSVIQRPAKEIRKNRDQINTHWVIGKFSNCVI